MELNLLQPYSTTLPTPNATVDKKNAAITATAKDFESVFLGHVLESIFSEVDMGGGFGDGSSGYAQDVYKSFLTNEYAKILSNQGGVGVADQVKRQMLQMQEVGAHHG